MAFRPEHCGERTGPPVGGRISVLVVVASTGGHYQGIEQFTVTAVRQRD